MEEDIPPLQSTLAKTETQFERQLVHPLEKNDPVLVSLRIRYKIELDGISMDFEK